MDKQYNISDYLGGVEELIEVVKMKRRINPQEKLKRKREYRASKGKIKQAQRRRRRTVSFKKQQRKAKKMAKFSKTSTGKRQSKFL